MESLEAPVPRYQIHTDLIARAGRSLEEMIDQRLCVMARRHRGEEREQRAPKTDPATGEVVFSAETSVLSLLELVRDYCGADPTFIHPDLTLLEAIFRVFLLNGNVPITLNELREQLDQFPGFTERLRPLTDEALSDIMTRDRYYGIRTAAPVDEV